MTSADVLGNIDYMRLAREVEEDMVGNATIGKAVTATLRVSPAGSGEDGLTWPSAFTTIQDALDAASTDEDDCTLILISPHTTKYDIDTTGDPTWAANVILQGTHRNWAKVMNNHASATSIMKLTGKVAIVNLNFNLGTSNNGLIVTHGGVRCYNSQFVGEDLTSTGIALLLDGDTQKHARIADNDFFGHVTYMTAVKIDQFAISVFERLRMHDCATCVQVVDANSYSNLFFRMDLGNSGVGFDVDAGNDQHFWDIMFHDNTVNIDDEVGTHEWINMYGSFPITIEPDNLVGTQVDTGLAGVWGGDTELRAAVASTVPFRVVGTSYAPSANEWFQVRFSADSGTSHYDVVQFDGNKREGLAAPSGTEFIFNSGTRISASTRSVTGGNNVKIWVEIQEI